MTKNSRARGRSQAIAGKIKENVGKRSGNAQRETTGAADGIQGAAKENAAKVAEQVVDATQEVSGTIELS